MTATIAAIGDSYTYNGTLGTRADQFYPYLLAKLLRARGYNLRARNFGRSGDSTPMVLSRATSVFNWETPDMVVVMCGINDTNGGHFSTVQVSPAPTSTTCSVAAGVGASMPVGSHITINGIKVVVTGQNVDALTFAPPYAGIASGQNVLPDTYANLVDIVRTYDNKSRPIIVGSPYLNFSAGGDTTSSETGQSAAIRAIQKQVATDEGIPYVDLYAYCKARILAGTDAQGSFTYHVLDNNSHPSPYGSQVWAQAIFDAVTALDWY